MKWMTAIKYHAFKDDHYKEFYRSVLISTWNKIDFQAHYSPILDLLLSFYPDWPYRREENGFKIRYCSK